MAHSARDTAVRVLAACRREGAWSDGKLKQEIRRAGLSRADAALCTRICYGVLQNRALLDFYLSHACDTPLKRLEPQLRDILEAAAYQILYLDRVPDSAAVNEAVEQAKAGKGRGAGLVNGVLRRLSAEKEHLPPLNCDTKQEYLSLKYSHPLWLTEKLYERFGRQDCEKLLAAHNTPVPTAVQVNTLKADPAAAVASLTGEGVAVREHPFLPGCLLLEDTGDLEELAAYRQGLMQIQDPAAKLAVLAAAPAPGMTVVDGCAAPGGKSFAAAMAMENRGTIYAFDLHAHKLPLVERGAERLGVTILQMEQRDARDVKETLAGTADLVLADVPCSGLGTIRKKPDVRYKRPEELAALPALQGEILAALARYVRPGGALVYSTCTILKEENEDVVAAFLRSHKEFTPESFALPGIGEVPGQITLLPHVHGTDGFFICKLRRSL